MAEPMKPLATKADSDRNELIDTWSHLIGKKQTYAQARDLDLAYAGSRPDPKLGYEPQNPAADSDEQDVLVRAAPGTKRGQRLPKPKKALSERGNLLASTSRSTSVRPVGETRRRTIGRTPLGSNDAE